MLGSPSPFLEWREDIWRGFKSKRTVMNVDAIKRDAYLERTVVVQLFAYRWPSVAVCNTFSSCHMKSTLVAPYFVPQSQHDYDTWKSHLRNRCRDCCKKQAVTF
jgi:hypothetical protein